MIILVPHEIGCAEFEIRRSVGDNTDDLGESKAHIHCQAGRVFRTKAKWQILALSPTRIVLRLWRKTRCDVACTAEGRRAVTPPHDGNWTVRNSAVSPLDADYS